MKKIFSAAATLFMFLPMISAQSNAEEVEYFQSIFGSEKKAIVASFIKLEGEANTSFWELYDAYESERKVLGKNRISLMEKYVETYDEITDKETDAMIAAMNKQKKSLDKLIDNYYKKIRKAAGSEAAAQFYHLEQYFLAAIRLSILESLPVIGELSN